jgi:tetratricopeptide (TPR) repeat protein
VTRLLLPFLLLLASCASTPYLTSDPIRVAEQDQIDSARKDLRNARFLMKRFRYEEARAILFRQSDNPAFTNWPPVRMEAAHTRGLYHLELSDLASALAEFQTALLIANRERLLRNEAEILNNIGLIRIRQGQADAALAVLTEAQKKSREPAVRLAVQNNLSRAWSMKNLNEQALKLLAKTVKEAHKRGLYAEEISALLLVSGIQAKTDPARALVPARQAFDAAEFWDDDRLRMESLEQLLTLYGQTRAAADAGKVRSALAFLRKKYGLPPPD